MQIVQPIGDGVGHHGHVAGEQQYPEGHQDEAADQVDPPQSPPHPGQDVGEATEEQPAEQKGDPSPIE